MAEKELVYRRVGEDKSVVEVFTPGRHGPIEERPASYLTEKGKIIEKGGTLIDLTESPDAEVGILMPNAQKEQKSGVVILSKMTFGPTQ